MKARFIIVLLFLVSQTAFAWEMPRRCSCGEFDTGVTVYWVGGECCSGLSVGGNTYYYAQETTGGWVITGNDVLNAQQAQGICCDQP